MFSEHWEIKHYFFKRVFDALLGLSGWGLGVLFKDTHRQMDIIGIQHLHLIWASHFDQSAAVYQLSVSQYQCQQPRLGSRANKRAGLPIMQAGTMSLYSRLKQGINEQTSLCHYTRGHHNEDITRSTEFRRTRGMRGCRNNGDIMARCHNEVSTYWAVPNNLLWVFTPIRHRRDRQEEYGENWRT